MLLTCTEAKRKLDIIKKEAESFEILLEDYAQHGTSETLDDLTEHRRGLDSLSQELRKDLEERLGYYRLHVSYAKLPGVAVLEQRFSGEHSISPLFDGRAWERHSSCAEIDETPGERVFWIAEIPAEFFGKRKRIKDVRDELAIRFEREGYRFAIETEAAEFADAQPELQRKNLILALGSSAFGEHAHRQCVAMLGAFGSRRVMGDWSVGSGMNHEIRLLLVRKEKS